MTTARTRVESALQLLGASSPIKKAGAEVRNKTFDTLVNMLELWGSENIAVPWTLPTTLGDELNEPPQTRLAIDYNLAVTVAPYIQKVATLEVKTTAKSKLATLRTQYSPKPRKKYPSTLPFGTGNRTRPLSPTFYPEEDSVATEQGVEITT